MQPDFIDLVGYKGFYKINKSGVVINTKGVIKKARLKHGYFHHTMSKNNIKKECRLHRLIASTFISNPKKYKTVNHKDGNKLNNSLSNLEWCTLRENILHAIKNGHMIDIGKVKPAIKIPFKTVLQMRKDFKKGLSQAEIARKYHTDSSNVHYIVMNKTRLTS